MIYKGKSGSFGQEKARFKVKVKKLEKKMKIERRRGLAKIFGDTMEKI